jgi:hypothetical protein
MMIVLQVVGKMSFLEFVAPESPTGKWIEN